jgi:hypothetical protein
MWITIRFFGFFGEPTNVPFVQVGLPSDFVPQLFQNVLYFRVPSPSNLSSGSSPVSNESLMVHGNLSSHHRQSTRHVCYSIPGSFRNATRRTRQRADATNGVTTTRQQGWNVHQAPRNERTAVGDGDKDMAPNPKPHGRTM